MSTLNPQDQLDNEIHRVNMALAKMMASARTWHSVTSIADAALNAHRIADEIRKERSRHMQEGTNTVEGFAEYGWKDFHDLKKFLETEGIDESRWEKLVKPWPNTTN